MQLHELGWFCNLHEQVAKPWYCVRSMTWSEWFTVVAFRHDDCCFYGDIILLELLDYHT